MFTTNQKKALAAKLAGRVLGRGGAHHPARDDFSAFKAAVYRRYVAAAHLDLLDEHLMAVARFIETGGADGIGRLIVAMPPRHGKSLTVSRLFPAWFLGRNPSRRVMLVSYGQSLADKNSRTARNLMRGLDYGRIFPRVGLAGDSQNVREWDIAGSMGEGGASALGIGGAATGKGAHLLIIDDPIKNRAEAESVIIRNRIFESYGADLYTRLEPGGAVVVMATRWHEDDLTGRLLRDNADDWVVLSLPALADDEGDILGRPMGGALWPARFDEAALDESRRTLGAYDWAALYQQNPRPSSGGIFRREWFEPAVMVVPRIERAVRFWDLAMSSKTGADYTVGVKMGLGADGNYYLLDVARGRVELADLPRFLRGVMMADGHEVKQGFENKGYMTRAIQELLKDRQLARHTIKGYGADVDKLTRALPLAARMAEGVVMMARGDWNGALVDEAVAFPMAAHDDQIDAAAGAWLMINEADRKPIKAEAKRYA